MNEQADKLISISEAARLTGSSVPRFYAEQNRDLLGLPPIHDENGLKRNPPPGGYKVSVARLIELGWLKEDLTPPNSARNEEAREWRKRIDELEAQLRRETIRADIAEERLRDKEAEIRRLEAKLLEL
jgi:hypothetical protein